MVRHWRPHALALDLGAPGVRRASSDAAAYVTPALWLAAALVAARFLPSVGWHEPWIDPDESIFLGGGAGFSPVIGPLAGALGVAGYLTLNAGIAMLLVTVAAALAREWGGEPARTAIAVAVAPALFWGVFVMPDLVGALGIVVWALALGRGRPWLAALVLALAITVDVTFAAVAFGWLVAALVLRAPLRPAIAGFGSAALVALALLRFGEYTDVGHGGSPVVFALTAVGWGLLATALVLLPLVPVFAYGVRLAEPARLPLLAVGLATFITAGYIGAGSALHANARYGLPLAVLVLCALSRDGYRASARVLVWSCLVVLAVGIMTPADESEALWIAAALSPAGYALALVLGGLAGRRGWPAFGLAMQSLVLVAVDLSNSGDVRQGLSIAAQAAGRSSCGT